MKDGRRIFKREIYFMNFVIKMRFLINMLKFCGHLSNIFFLISLFVIPLIITAGVMVYLCSRMRTARLGSEASEYIVPGSEHMTERYDIYTHTTVTRTKIPKDNDTGGTTINSGGFSSSSGKF